MDGKKLREITSSIDKKLGEDKSAIIADDIGTIMTGFETMSNEIAERDKTIEQLKEDNKKLVASNGNLLRQITVTSNEDEEEKEVTTKDFNFRDAFDEKGNFKK